MHTGSLVFNGRSGYSAALFSSCPGMKILSEAKLPIYQKSSVAHGARVERGLRLLRQLKCLTALKSLQQVSELYRCDALNLMSYMTLQEQNCVQFICLYVRCYGTTGLPWPFVFHALVEIVFRFFDTDLPVPIRLSVIEFNERKSLPWLSWVIRAKLWKLLK